MFTLPCYCLCIYSCPVSSLDTTPIFECATCFLSWLLFGLTPAQMKAEPYFLIQASQSSLALNLPLPLGNMLFSYSLFLHLTNSSSSFLVCVLCYPLCSGCSLLILNPVFFEPHQTACCLLTTTSLCPSLLLELLSFFSFFFFSKGFFIPYHCGSLKHVKIHFKIHWLQRAFLSVYFSILCILFNFVILLARPK